MVQHGLWICFLIALPLELQTVVFAFDVAFRCRSLRYAMKQQNLRVKQELQELIDSQKQANERLNYLLHVVIPPLTPLPSVQGITTKASFEV